MTAAVLINEVGLRDGLQSQAALVPLEGKLQLAAALADAGLCAIEATSFVSPRAVPQMADADALLPLLPARPGLCYSALAPNLRGLDRALAAGAQEIAVVLSATETMNRRNIGMGLDEAGSVSAQVLRRARELGLRTKAYLAVAFGCPFEGAVPAGRVLALAATMAEAGADELVLADTIGAAYPAAVDALFGAAARLPGVPRLAAHFHDTRGMALANAWAAYAQGVRRFDASLGGLGGCPFAPGAAGNVATEDLVLMFEGCGVATGIDLPRLHQAIALAETLTGQPLGGRSMRWQRQQATRRQADTAGAAA